MPAAAPDTRQPGRCRMPHLQYEVRLTWLPLTRGWDHKEARIRMYAQPEV